VKVNVFTFSWKMMNRVRIIEVIVVNHVDVSSCGMSLWRDYSLSLT
jgi:hypothetical protein